MDERDALLNELLKRDVLVEPEVVDYLLERGGRNYIEEFLKRYGDLGYVSLSDIKEIQVTTYKKSGVEKSTFTKPEAYEYDWDFKVIMDASVTASATGGVEDFQRLFLDRFERISSFLRNRPALQGARSINRLEDGDVAVVGIVAEVRRTNKGTLIFELEDPTGMVTCVHSGDGIVLNDEVIGVRGRYSRSRKTIYVREIIRPDIPWGRRNRRIEENIGAAIISDVHVGSKMFIEDRWKKFLRWLKSGKDGAEIVKYLVIAGDLVDGIGIYPNQEEELDILDIFQQYETLASYLQEIPDYIKVIMIPGNHDIVRNAEPQPALPNEITKMFDSNVEVLSNPSMFSLHGYKFLLYHGASLNTLVELIPGMDYQKTSEMMEYMLKFRHLSPVYGDKVPIVPIPRDFLVIDTVPDVFVTGHVHTFSYKIYKGVHLVNASAWQKQTKYQKMMNFNPDPGKVAIVNFHEDSIRVKAF